MAGLDSKLGVASRLLLARHSPGDDGHLCRELFQWKPTRSPDRLVQDAWFFVSNRVRNTFLVEAGEEES